jgi:hypothetical protein
MRYLMAAALAAVVLAPGAALADYWVYCDHGRIVVDSRNPEQMRIARGSSACLMSQTFTSYTSAEGFMQRNFPSGTCSCR